MILTLTLNPALDLAIHTDRIAYDDRTYITGETRQPGGKGVNAARVLHGYGADVQAIATFGGDNGQRFAQLLEELELPVRLIPVAGETRRNISVTDSHGLTLKLDQRGSPLASAELDTVQEVLQESLPNAEWLTLTGSLPPGTNEDCYGRLIEMARDHGVQTLLDTSGAALAQGLRAKPSLAKPNRPEAERLLGRSLVADLDALKAAREICALGAGRTILSLGGQGAVASWEQGLLRATTPPARAGSPIGAGDVLGATAIWALNRGESFPDAFVWGVAAATVAASRPGLGAGTPDEVQQMRSRVELLTI